MGIRELFRHWSIRLFAPDMHLRTKYRAFKDLLEADNQALEIIADLETHFYGLDPADSARIRWLLEELEQNVRVMVNALIRINPTAYSALTACLRDVCRAILKNSPSPRNDTSSPLVLPLEEVADLPQLAGGKAAHLAIARKIGIPTPEGIVIASSAFFLFLQANGLDKVIETRFREISLANQEAITRVCGEIQELILTGIVPEQLKWDVRRQMAKTLPQEQLFAVRSSALAEDGEISFAGQYTSELNVGPDELFSAYKRVLAGKYCPRAVSYRIAHGLSDANTAMAVLVIPMIDHGVSGVAYSRDPACPAVGGESIGIYAVSGLANELVEGTRTPDRYYLNRKAQPILLAGCQAAGPILPTILQKLGKYCMILEEHFGSPQDIEWALDKWQQPIILQSRQLCQEKEQAPLPPEQEETSCQLLSGLTCASAGIACGPVFRAENGHDFPLIPQGSVLITSSLRPSLALFLDRTVAVLATTGSRASHLASVARQYGVPILVGDGLDQLSAGSLVTVDAGAGSVSAGCQLAVLARSNKVHGYATEIRRSFISLADLSVRLRLTDSSTDGFIPENCQSLHDIIRFCHEKGVSEMFSIVQRGGRGMARSKRLNTDLPLVMYILDLGGGLYPHIPERGDINPTYITSLPMHSCWKGMSDTRIPWSNNLIHVDWEDFDRISGGIFSRDTVILASYAVISRDYMHMNIRFGYHFSILDSICGDVPGANYIHFRFKGGGTAMEGRMLRLLFISKILSKFGFAIASRGDMLDATIRQRDLFETRSILKKIGLLLASTRMLDTRLECEDDVQTKVSEFLSLADSCANDEQ